jgi:hypothetical protein
MHLYSFRLALASVFALALLSGCASAPKDNRISLQSDKPLQLVKDENHLRIEQYVNQDAMRNIQLLRVPRYQIAEGAYAQPINDKQASIVANHAARSLCKELAPYIALTDEDREDAARLQIAINTIKPTGTGSAAISSLLSFVVPGPISRLPSGLGGLAAEVELRQPNGEQVFVTRWARGANSVMDDARLSSIGDAWQLANDLGNDVATPLLDTDSQRNGLQRNKLSNEQIDANRELCDRSYGTLRIAARGAGFLLPMSPESMDPGPPERQTEAGTEAMSVAETTAMENPRLEQQPTATTEETVVLDPEPEK